MNEVKKYPNRGSNLKPLDPLQLSMVKDTLKTQAEFLGSELIRLRAMEDEYKKLLTLISVIVDRDFRDDVIHIRITKAAQLRGMDWREILEMSMGVGEK